MRSGCCRWCTWSSASCCSRRGPGPTRTPENKKKFFFCGGAQKRKRPGSFRKPGLERLSEPGLGHFANVLRLQPLRALHHFELHLLPLGKSAEAVRLDRRVVAEDVLTAPALGDEAVALGVVEPLHSSSRHSRLTLRENGSAEIAEIRRAGSPRTRVIFPTG